MQDRDNLKPLLRTKSTMPCRLVPLPWRSRDHTTSGLAFLAFQSHTNRRKQGQGAVPDRETWKNLGQRGPRLGDPSVTRLDSEPRRVCKTCLACLRATKERMYMRNLAVGWVTLLPRDAYA